MCHKNLLLQQSLNSNKIFDLSQQVATLKQLSLPEEFSCFILSLTSQLVIS